MSNQQHRPWVQGRLLDTNVTRKYSEAERQRAEVYERERVFINFHTADQGISRGLVGVFTNEDFALKAIKCVNEHEELLKYKTACEGINPDNPMAVAENLESFIDVCNNLIKVTHDEKAYDIIWRQFVDLYSILTQKK